MKPKTFSKKNFFTSFSYSKLRITYMILFMFAVFTRVLLPISLHEPQFINTLVFSFVALFGASLIIIDFFSEKIMFSGKNCVFLIWFLIITFISCILNIKYGFIGNIRNLIWMSISFFILYPTNPKSTKSDVYKELRIISNILIIVWFLAVLFSFALFLIEFGKYIIVSSEVFFRVGFIESRLFGIFEDPNFAATTSIIVIMLSLWNIKSLNNKTLNIFYILNIILQFFYIVLSGSRTAELCLLSVIFILIYFILRKKFFNNIKQSLKELINIFLSVFLCFITVILMSSTKIALSYLPPIIASQIATTQNPQNKLKPVVIEREDIKDSSDVSSCRIKIWKSAIELFKSRFLFGTSPRNMRSFAKENFPDGFIAKRSYAVHNIYLDVLTSTGIIGVTFFILFLIKSIFQILKYLFTSKSKQNYYMVLLCASITASIAISAIFLTEILFVNTIGVLFFWLLLGYSMHFIKEEV